MNEHAPHLPPQPLQFVSLCFVPLPSPLLAHPSSKPFTGGLSPKTKCHFFGGVSPILSLPGAPHSSVFITLSHHSTLRTPC